MIRLSVFCFSMIAALVLSAEANAQNLLFDADQFGNINLEFRQSSSGDQYEAILGNTAKFEPLITYSADSALRRLSEAIGRLDVRHGSRGMETCTASVVSSSLILTNYHCVPGLGNLGPVTAAQLVMGYYDQADTSTVRRYTVSPVPVEANRTLDYALLRVSENPAARFGTIKILNEDPKPGASLLMFHHPAGYPKHVTRSGCRVAGNYKANTDKILHSCDTLPGSSGAPVFAEFGRGVLGLHYAGPGSLGPGQYNSAKRMVRLLAASPGLRINQNFSQPLVPESSQAELSESAKLRNACDGGSAYDCAVLGYKYATGEGVSQSYVQAVPYFRRGCDGGEAWSCTNLGFRYENGQGVTRNYAEAARYYRKACDGGSAIGCANLGILYDNGRGVSQNYAEAARYYRKACDSGDAKGCANLGSLYAEGTGVTKNYAEAVRLFRNACDAGYVEGCADLGVRYDNGQGVTRNYAEAARYYRMACDGGSAIGCYNLGRLYEYGKGVTRNKTQALRYYRKACNGGDQISCDTVRELQ